MVFEGGRQEAVPDLEPLLKPSTAGDIAAYGMLIISILLSSFVVFNYLVFLLTSEKN